MSGLIITKNQKWRVKNMEQTKKEPKEPEFGYFELTQIIEKLRGDLKELYISQKFNEVFLKAALKEREKYPQPIPPKTEITNVKNPVVS